MGLQATPDGRKQAKVALAGLKLNQQKLADRLDVTRQPIGKFFTGKSVSDEVFVRICEVLKLDWKLIADIAGPLNPPILGDLEKNPGSAPPNLGAGGPLAIANLVAQTRAAIRPLIQAQCGTMRVLDMDKPIALTGKHGIYTNVNILEKLTRLRSEKEFQENCDIDWFDDRLGLGKHVKCLPGLKAVKQYRRLMVLGKPGAGKSTFLKHLAMQYITGGSKAEKVPFFVTLKDFAEAPGKPGLLAYLVKAVKGLTIESLEQLLDQGRSLVLLDGLDEVREEDNNRVIREMRETADRFKKSQFVITCRIAAKEYTFERFTEVEVADFNEEQITAFAENWFRAKKDLPKAKTFIARIKKNNPIQELASSPLLLTLLCWVFGEGGDFPTKRADLYEEGVKILLKKWDAKRNIKRDDIYKKLDVQRREDLLGYLALQAFQEKEYFIKQRRIEGYIADFISNLRDIDPDPEALRMDSEKILQSIQSQHGLLVERARGIYSFSHLTFQEYFTAREIATTKQLSLLVARLSDKHWREVFLLTAGMMRNADDLLLKMKLYIDLILDKDEKIQQFLQWVNQKVLSVQVSYKPAAVRSFYFALTLDLTLDLALDLDRTLDLDLDRARARTSDLDLDLALALVLDRALNRALALTLDCARVRALDCAWDRALDRALNRARALALALDRLQNRELKLKLQEISDRLPKTSQENLENFKLWWQTNGTQWTEDLRQITIAHRNIGHDWQFTEAQKQLLQKYYDANLLLVECLNSDCYISRPIRQEIEDTLLLPIAEIEKRKTQ
jgi:predicted NACHT family NTPase